MFVSYCKCVFIFFYFVIGSELFINICFEMVKMVFFIKIFILINIVKIVMDGL